MCTRLNTGLNNLRGSLRLLRPEEAGGTFVQHRVGRLVPRQRLLGQVLVRLGQTFHLCEASVERHGRVAGVLRHVQVSRPPQLLLDHQCLLQQLHRGLDIINTLVLGILQTPSNISTDLDSNCLKAAS